MVFVICAIGWGIVSLFPKVAAVVAALFLTAGVVFVIYMLIDKALHPEDYP